MNEPDGYIEYTIIPTPKNLRKRVIYMRTELCKPEPEDMLLQVQRIYAGTVASFSKKLIENGELTSQEIKDFNTLMNSMAIINKEVRESKKAGILERLPLSEQLKLLAEALEDLGD